LDAHKGPASSWTDTEEYRGEIRRSAKKKIKTLSENKANWRISVTLQNSGDPQTISYG